MSDLGELLVLLHGARRRVATVRAIVRNWRHQQRMREAMQRTERAGSVTLFGPAVGPEGVAVENVLRVWLAPPDRAREEREGADGEGFDVRRGSSWWRYDCDNGAMAGEDERGGGGDIGGELWWLLDAAPLIGLLDFDTITAGRQAGRSTLRVRAVPREPAAGDDMPLLRLGAGGADELWLDVDEQRGALLRVEGRLAGEPFNIWEVTEIAFDETFADDVFEFTPPPGEPIRSFKDEFGLERDLTIEQAVARASFTVWIPSRVPAGWVTAIAFAAASDRPRMAPQVHLHCRAQDGTHAVNIAESPAGHPGEHSDYEHARPGPWRQIERDGRSMEIREPAESWQPAQVRLELDGTRIHIHSGDLTADWLADLAAGLVPAPPEPPAPGL